MTLTAPAPIAPAAPDRPGGARPARSRGRLPLHWPLTALLLGYPVWWLLGVSWVAPVAAAGAMTVQLLRRRTVRTPPAFLVWLLFMVWVVLALTMLWVDAPGAVPGGGGPGRLAVSLLRLGEYTSVTVVLLWVGTLTEAELPRRWVRTCLSGLFVTTVVGGLAGVLLPTLDFPSLLELLLPGSLAGDPFVESLVHPGLADVQTVLGYEQARPKAPFDFTNTWGANFSMLLPFFVISWLRDGRRWQRVLGPLVIVAGAVPVVFSLNRALWATLAVAALGLVVVLARHGRRTAIVVAAGALVAAVAVVLLSPLGGVLADRLDAPHSNERRGLLLEQTVTSVVEGSPVVGFGTTREVQGSFASIAGGATGDCSACAVPPLGTQGLLWLIVFSQGLVGLALFLSWLAVLASWCWRAATTSQALLLFPLATFVVQLTVYDTLVMPLLVLMAAAGLVWRERAGEGYAGGAVRGRPTGSTLGALRRAARADARLVGGVTVLGLLAGGGLVLTDRAPTYAARAAVLLVPAPVALADATGLTDLDAPTEGTAQQRAALRGTVDTEAALVVADETLDRVTDGSATAAAGLRDRTRVTAPPNTQVLVLEVRAPTADGAEEDVLALVDSYLATRRGYLRDRQTQLVDEVQRELRAATQAATAPVAGAGGGADEEVDQARFLDEDGVTLSQVEVEASLREALARLQATTVQAGQLLRVEEPVVVRPAHEVRLVSGLALGLLAGVGLALGRRALGRR